MNEISKMDPWELPRFRHKAEKEKISLPKRLWEGWKKAGMFIANVNLKVLVFVVYWTVFAITAIVAKILGRDWLQIKTGGDNYWKDLPDKKEAPNENYRQF